MRKHRSLKDEYRFPNFVPVLPVRGIFGDPRAVVITLFRRGKKRAAVTVARVVEPITTSAPDVFATCRVATSGCISTWTCGASDAFGVAL